MSWSDPAFWRNAATLFFFLFFCGVIAWAFRSRRSRTFRDEAALPLEEGRPVNPAPPSRHG